MAKQEISIDDLIASINYSRIDFYAIKHQSMWSNDTEHAGSLSWDNSVLGFAIKAYFYTETAIQEYLKDKGIHIQHLEKSRKFYITYEDYINLITLLKLKGE